MRSLLAVTLFLAACGHGGSGGGGGSSAPPAPAGWTSLAPSGTAPAARWGHTAILHAGRMIVFGGADSVDGTTFNDLRALDLASPAWSTLPSAGLPPSTRHGHGAILDAANQRMILFGGRRPLGGGAQTLFDDVWSLDLAASPATWTQLTPAGAPPSARFGHSVSYDAVQQRLIVFGGANGIGTPAFNDVWALNLAGPPAWTSLAPAGTPPSARYLAASVLDASNNRLVVFGGFTTGGLSNDVWTLDLATPAWTSVAVAGTPPTPRYGGVAVFDAAGQRMIHFGGATAPGGPTVNETWTLDLGPAPAWSQPAFPGTPPSSRYVGTAIVDGSRLFTFGGTTAPFNPAAALAETWSLDW